MGRYADRHKEYSAEWENALMLTIKTAQELSCKGLGEMIANLLALNNIVPAYNQHMNARVCI